MQSKLIKELPELVENNVISTDIAVKIEQYFESKQGAGANKLFTIFGVLGSLLVGLGIILILAHNWDHFSKIIKTILAFTPLLLGQVLVGYTIFKKKGQTWREASGTFLFFAVGAAMAMVSQIYNIPGDMSSYLLTWSLLCAPLIYLLKSHALALLHIVYATSYACSFGYFAFGNSPWLYLFLLAILMPYYIKLIQERPEANMTSIFNWLLPLSLVIVLGAFVSSSLDLVLLAYFILFGLFYNIGKTSAFLNAIKLRQNGYLLLGSLGTVVLLLMASFRGLWKELLYNESFFSLNYTTVLVLFGISLGVFVYGLLRKRVQLYNLFHYVFIIMSVLYFVNQTGTLAPTIISNILLLFLGLNAVKIGVDKTHFGILNYGLLIITSLVFCRFVDTDMGYTIKGILFVVVGLGFFATNYVMLKKQNSKSDLS